MVKAKNQIYFSAQVEDYLDAEIAKIVKMGGTATRSIICQRDMLKIAIRSAKRLEKVSK